MKRDITMLTLVAKGIDILAYLTHPEATEQLMDLLDSLSDEPLEAPYHYSDMYNASFVTFPTWDALVESEAELSPYGLTEEECLERIGDEIWKLPCGWYVQRIE